MWNFVIVAVMAALTGFYTLSSERSVANIKDQETRVQAESMGVYRQAVIAYFTAHNVTGTSVDIDTMKNEGMVPTWSTLYTDSAASIWANYRDSAGIIYIYPTTLPSANIVNEVLKLSKYSMNVGIYSTSDGSLYSPADGNRITLTPLPGVSIPDTAPVWMAARN